MLKPLLRWVESMRADQGTSNMNLYRSFSNHDATVVDIVCSPNDRARGGAAEPVVAVQDDASVHGASSRRSLDDLAVIPRFSPTACRDAVMRPSWASPNSARMSLISADSVHPGTLGGQSFSSASSALIPSASYSNDES